MGTHLRGGHDLARKKTATSRRHEAPAATAAAARAAPDWPMVAIALAGMVVTAALLWGADAQGRLPYCPAGSGCDIVQASPWSRLLGLPLALWGFGAYLLLGLVAATGAPGRRRRAMAVLATAGFGVSLYLTAISWFVIGALCPYCLVSAALQTVAFVLSLRHRAAVGAARYGSGAGLAVVVALVLQVQAGGTGGSSGAPDPWLLDLAARLSASGARFYGASWCPHCQQQKAAFGVAASALPYVECSPNGPKAPRATDCEMADIRNYPTWVIGGQRLERILQPKELAVLVGHPLPSEKTAADAP